MRKDKKIFITFILVLIISIFLSYLFFINGSTNKLFGNANDFIASIDDEENLNSYPIIKMFFNSSGEKKVNDDVVLTLDAESRYNINKVEYSFDLKNWKVLNKKYDKKNITAKIIFNNDMNKEVYVRVINEKGYKSYPYKTIVMIDKTNPKLNLNKINNGVTISVSDEDLKKLQYSNDKLVWVDEDISGQEIFITKFNFNYKYVRAVDSVGNISEIKKIV